MAASDDFQAFLGLVVVRHGRAIAASFLFFCALQALGGLLISSVWPDRWEKLPRKKRTDLQVSLAAGVHALVASLLALVALFVVSGNIHEDRIYGESPLSSLLFAMSTGYFIWDIAIVLFHRWPVGFLAHALACLFVYANGLRPFLHFWGCIFMLYELSTPIMHVRSFLITLGFTEGPLLPLAEKSFAAVFFVARIVIGLPASAWWWFEVMDLLRRGEAPSEWVVRGYLLCNGVLNVLNVYWFVLMLRKFLSSGRRKSSTD